MGNKPSKSKKNDDQARDPSGSSSTVTKTKLLVTEPKFQFEYPIDGKGLFVIIRNDTMEYKHYLDSAGAYGTFNNLSVGYQKDEDMLKETFQINKSHSNVLIGRNLHQNDNSEDKFDSFMKEVEQKATELQKGQKDKPKFVFFVLMSHGLENGVFLLGDNLPEPCCRPPRHKCNKSEPKPKCCRQYDGGDCCRKRDEKYHSQTGDCHERRVKEDIIEPIQERFKGIPKIFIIQACRGGKSDDLLSNSKNKSDDIKPLKVENFIPRSADTIVLYSGANEQICYVNNSPAKDNPVGSLLIYEFCQAVQQLRRKLVSIEPTLARLRNVTGPPIDDDDEGEEESRDEGEDDVLSNTMSFIQTELAGTHNNPDIRMDVESAIGGWFDDNCRLTAFNVAHRYLIEQDGYDKDNELVSREALTKAQPEVVSTLNSRVSCIKLMRTQIPDWGTSPAGGGDATS